VPTLRKGGGERFALDIAIAQRALAHTEEVLLLVMAELDDYSDYSHRANLRFIDSRYLPSITGRAVSEIAGYREVVRSFRPDVIHTHLFGAELLSAAWVYPSALYVTHCHDKMEEFDTLSLRRLSKRALTNYYERTLIMYKKYRKVRPYFVANSEDTYNYFKRVLPRRLAARVEIIPYGFRFGRFFHPQRSPRTRPSETLVLTMVASFLAPKKNQEFLIDVAAYLKRRGRLFHLNLVGDGPRRPQVEAYARERGVAEEVQFWGLVTNVEDILWQTDLYVHSATYEPFGLVFLEGMAAGLPCVALDGGGNRSLIRDDHNGFLVRTFDPIAFGERVLEVAASPLRYAEMSRNAIALASDFDIAKCAERLVAFYETKIEQASAGTAPARHLPS
jgi:glycosyltransferase involved in cell wall biosynthesis